MAEFNKSINKKVYYRVIKTREVIDGVSMSFYGIEGFSGDEVVSVEALTDDYKRIKSLVCKMSECELELCHFKNVIDDFLYDCYGNGIKCK